MNFPIRTTRAAPVSGSVSLQGKVLHFPGRRPQARSPGHKPLICRWHRTARGELTCFWEAEGTPGEGAEESIAPQVVARQSGAR